MKLIEFENFSAGILKNINLRIDSGEIILLSGPNFSGKSVLLKSMKKNLLTDYSGIAKFFVDDKEISYVPQNSDVQLILSTVLNELVFQMENLQFDSSTINKRLAECVNFFGIADLLDKDINELSGGQKELVILCSAIITRPKIVLLDDVFSQLDVIAQNNLLNLIKLMHDEFGMTFVISSNDLDNIINICGRMIFLNGGIIIFDDSIQISMRKLFSSSFKSFLPIIPKLSIENNMKKICFTPQEFNACMQDKSLDLKYTRESKNIDKSKRLIRIENVSYKYAGQSKFVINNLSWDVPCAVNCLMGANGSGKTTLLKLIAGITKPYCGCVKYLSRNIKYMPQNVLSVFTQSIFDKQIINCGNKKFLFELIDMFNVSFALNENIYELPQSCQQILAFIYLITDMPDIFILDEPTKFVDKNNIDIMVKVLINLNSTVLIATHDIGFVNLVADNCIMLLNGDIAYEQDPDNFFSDNSFYNLPINKINGFGF